MAGKALSAGDHSPSFEIASCLLWGVFSLDLTAWSEFGCSGNPGSRLLRAENRRKRPKTHPRLFWTLSL